MIVIVWTYDVPEAARADFEAAYGPQGAWAKLFARSPDYQSTELLHDGAGLYATLDHWRTQESFAAFRAEHAEDYETLDRACARLTSAERFIGAFERA
jgi:heme-degrading monooxygenase HmoA